MPLVLRRGVFVPRRGVCRRRVELKLAPKGDGAIAEASLEFIGGLVELTQRLAPLVRLFIFEQVELAWSGGGKI